MTFDDSKGGAEAHRLLVVEDGPADVRLISEELEAEDFDCEIHAVGDGEEGLAFLKRRGAYEEAPQPDLVLLDMDLARAGEQTLLDHLEDDPDLRRIPVVVFNCSEPRQDVERSYPLHADSFVAEPLDLPSLTEALRGSGRDRVRIAHLPRPRHVVSPPTQRL